MTGSDNIWYMKDLDVQFGQKNECGNFLVRINNICSEYKNK